MELNSLHIYRSETHFKQRLRRKLEHTFAARLTVLEVTRHHCYSMRINRNTFNSSKFTIIKDVMFFKHLSQYKIPGFCGANVLLIFKTSHDCHVSIFDKIYLNVNKMCGMLLRSVHTKLYVNR
jgi:hypothetical protein